MTRHSLLPTLLSLPSVPSLWYPHPPSPPLPPSKTSATVFLSTTFLPSFPVPILPVSAIAKQTQRTAVSSNAVVAVMLSPPVLLACPATTMKTTMVSLSTAGSSRITAKARSPVSDGTGSNGFCSSLTPWCVPQTTRVSLLSDHYSPAYGLYPHRSHLLSPDMVQCMD